jgi:protein-disulfide isomerase
VNLQKECYTNAFNRCVSERRYATWVADGIAEGKRFGVGGTPEFLIGYFDDTDPDTLKVVKRISGAGLIEDSEAGIQAALDATGNKEEGQ